MENQVLQNLFRQQNDVKFQTSQIQNMQKSPKRKEKGGFYLVQLSTCLMCSGVIGDFHGVHLQALRAFTNVVDPGDVGTLFVYHLHHLKEKKTRRNSIVTSFSAELSANEAKHRFENRPVSSPCSCGV